MDNNRTRLVEELQELSLGLRDSNTLLLKQTRKGLMCQFLSHGLVRYTTIVTSNLLAKALWQVSSLGILDGADFMLFKNVFDKFSLHLKARQLYAELGQEQPELDLQLQNLLVA